MRDNLQQYGYRRIESLNKAALHKSSSGWLSTVICAALILVTIAAYEPLRHNDFINLDDPRYVTENQHIRTGITFEGIKWAFAAVQTSHWHPLTMLSHILDCQLFGLNPKWHHLVNLLFHIANTLLFFRVLKDMTGTLWQSAFVAAAFALHPLHVESVAWVAERKDVLSTLFWLLTMAAYVRYIRYNSIKWYVVTLLLFALGLMAKSMLVTLPFVLLLLDYWPLERLKNKSNIKHLIFEKIPLFILSAISSITAFFVMRAAGNIISVNVLPLKIRAANSTVSYAEYIGKMIWPNQLAVFYPLDSGSLSVWQIASAALLLSGISIWVIWLSPKYKYLLVGWLWYLGTLVPVIGLVQVGNQAMADRYTYLPSIGVFIMIAWGFADLSARWRFGKIIFRTAAITTLAILLICTRMQVKLWKNSFTLFEHTLKVTQNNYIIHNNYGIALSQAGRPDEGILQFRRSLQINPQHANAHYNLGLALAKTGQLEEAIIHLRKSLEFDSNSPSTLINLAGVLIMDKNSRDYNCAEAVRLAERACKLTDYKNPQMLNILEKAKKAASSQADGNQPIK